ncbi:hypothetical protein Pst134EA_024325 [Puccinia striiformis f. sp. tritici]|uniref:hypothetical protein n=1 Tax=Puccinia striiformis f. sp. tritici TaxID=168172 RepID=UPI0020071E93|nr:hypothetical protein Pst134EA_024325 [Puccinia striiformis f. sp. tritici]KAH9453449.1 hypothetical protein Pst134EA_024325 [Puccinia striiformis f. sp. tritici]
MRSAPPPKVRRGILGPFPLDKSLVTVAEEEEYNPKPEEPTRVEGGDSDSIEETDDEEEDEEEEDDGRGAPKFKDPVSTTGSGCRQSCQAL